MPSSMTSRYGVLARAAALAIAVTVGSGCSGLLSPAPAASGGARVAVAARSLSSAVASVQLTISAGSAGGSAFSSIVETMTLGTDGAWTTYVTGIPVGPGRLFAITALDSSGNTLYTGSGTADITAGAVATVVITLNQTSGTSYSTSAPVIQYISASATLVPPGGTVLLGASASDADPTATLTYQWAAVCGTFNSATSSSVTWTAPSTAENCQISVTVTNNGGSSVTAYLVIDVGITTGDVLVTVTGSTSAAPVISGMTVQVSYGTTPAGSLTETGTVAVTASDPNGSTLSYAWTSNCSSLTFDTASPNSPMTPAFANGNASQACVVTVTVSDALGGTVTGVVDVPGAPAFQYGPVITVTTQPSVTAGGVEIVNPGGAVPLTVQATDPQGNNLKFSWAASAGTITGEVDSTHAPWMSAVTYNVPNPLPANMQVTVTVTDTVNNEFATHVFTFAGASAANPCAGQANGTACSTGNLCLTGQTCQGGACSGGTAVVCTASDQCHSAGTCSPSSGCSNPAVTNGTPCNDGNGCTTNDVCASGVCMGASVTCSNTTNLCQAATGTCAATSSTTFSCTYANLANGTSCSGGNLCTPYTCTAGVCGGTPVTCSGSATCNPSTGTCSSGASPALLTGVLTASATTVVSGQTFSVAFAVTDSGGTAADGVQPAALGGATCTGGTPAAITIPAGSTTTFQFTGCSITGTASPVTLSTSAAGTDAVSSASVSTGTVSTSVAVTTPVAVVTPQVARDLPVVGPTGLAMDTSGNSYLVGSITSTNPVTLDGHSVQSDGNSNLFVAAYGSDGVNTWALGSIGDGTDAVEGVGAAVTNNGTVAAIGSFTGTFSILGSADNTNCSGAGGTCLSSASAIDFLVGFEASNGTGLWANQFNDGEGELRAVAANAGDASAAHGNRIAVCGYANTTAPANLVGSTATAVPYNSIIIGVFNSSGTKIWASQFIATGVNNTSPASDCQALAIDDNGDVFATGTLQGASLNFGGATSALTGPDSSLRKYVWVAKFNGTTGAAEYSAIFNGTAGLPVPGGIAVDSGDNVSIAGEFTTNITFGSTTLTSAGGEDAFVAHLGPTFTPLWAVRMGGTIVDVANGVAVDSTGEVFAVGTFNRTATISGTFGTYGADLVTTGASSNPFLLQVNGATGAIDFATSYGDSATSSATGIAVNRYGTSALNQVAVVGTYVSTLNFPAPAGSITATNATDVWLTTASLQVP